MTFKNNVDWNTSEKVKVNAYSNCRWDYFSRNWKTYRKISMKWLRVMKRSFMH